MQPYGCMKRGYYAVRESRNRMLHRYRRCNIRRYLLHLHQTDGSGSDDGIGTPALRESPLYIISQLRYPYTKKTKFV